MWIGLFTKNKIRKNPEPAVCYAAKFTLDLKDIQYKGRAIGSSENLGGGQAVLQGILKKNVLILSLSKSKGDWPPTCSDGPEGYI